MRKEAARSRKLAAQLRFIKRHAADANPYFVMVTFTAPHVPTTVPKRTEAHYRTSVGGVEERPRRPTDAVKYWGMIEELDAAVGRIVALLHLQHRLHQQRWRVEIRGRPALGGDVAPDQIDTLRGNSDIVVSQASIPHTWLINVNHRDKPFSDVKVRQAASLAVCVHPEPRPLRMVRLADAPPRAPRYAGV